MKKIYLTIAFAAVFTGPALAQSDYYTGLGKKVFPHIESETRTETAAISSRAAGDTIWYDDFSDYNNWILGNENDPNTGYNWIFTDMVTSGLVAQGFDNVLNSATPDQFVMVDSDSEGESGIQNCYIQMANPVDLSSYSAVNLQWTQYYRHFNDPHFVEVSTDGGANWTSFEVNTELGNSVNSDNPGYGLVNISSAAAGQAQVWIRFRYEGAWGWFWCVDDVAITESFANDLLVLQTFHGDVVNDYEYSRLPLEQAHEVVAGVIIKNNGAEEQTNVNVAWEVVTASGVVANGTDQTLTSSASGSIDTLWIPTGYTPDALGQVTVNVTVTADAADEVPEDNEGSSFMVITEYDYGHDEDSEWDVFTGGYIDDNEATVSYEHGVVVLGYNAGSVITAVKAAFGPNISANGTTSFTVNVYREDAFRQVELLSETIWDVNVTVADEEYTTIVLDNPVEIEEGLVYIVTIGVEAGSDMYFYGNSTDDDFASRVYGPLGTGGAVDWYVSGRSPAIQAVVDPSVGVEENEHVSGVYMYPNPANDNLTVGFVSKDGEDLTVNILGVDGSLIASEQVVTKAGQSNTARFDVNNLAAGMYMVQIIGSKSSLTQRVVVQ
jgi:hypothetical protein